MRSSPALEYSLIMATVLLIVVLSMNLFMVSGDFCGDYNEINYVAAAHYVQYPAVRGANPFHRVIVVPRTNHVYLMEAEPVILSFNHTLKTSFFVSKYYQYVVTFIMQQFPFCDSSKVKEFDELSGIQVNMNVGQEECTIDFIKKDGRSKLRIFTHAVTASRAAKFTCTTHAFTPLEPEGDLPPDAEMRIDTDQSEALLGDTISVLFFGPFHLTVRSKEYEKAKQEGNYRKLIEGHEIHANYRWISCLDNFCFDFYVDSAYSIEVIDSQEVVLMIGENDYFVDHWPPAVSNFQQPQTRSWPNAMSEKETLFPVAAYYISSTSQVHYFTFGHQKSIKPGFPMVNREFGQNFGDHLTGRTYSMAILKALTSIDGTKDGKVWIMDDTTLIPFLEKPRNVQGADVNSAFVFKETLYLLSGNFYYEIKMSDLKAGGMFTGPHPIFTREFLNECPDQMYDNIEFRKYLNIKSKDDFYYWINRKIITKPDPTPKPTDPTTTPTTPSKTTTTPKPDATSTDPPIYDPTTVLTTTVMTGDSPTDPKSKSKDKSGLTKIIAGVVGGIIALALMATIVFFVLRNKKRKNKASKNTSTETVAAPRMIKSKRSKMPSGRNRPKSKSSSRSRRSDKVSEVPSVATEYEKTEN